jgi:hypothetical protein
MKFTTNWRVSFGYQPDSRDAIQEMACGNTLVNAFVKAIEKADFSEPKDEDAPQNTKESEFVDKDYLVKTSTEEGISNEKNIGKVFS